MKIKINMNNLQDTIYNLTDTTQKELCQNELDELYRKAKEFFEVHETMMVRLCYVLEMNCLEATEEDILERVKQLQEFRVKILESSYYIDDERCE